MQAALRALLLFKVCHVHPAAYRQALLPVEVLVAAAVVAVAVAVGAVQVAAEAEVDKRIMLLK